MTEETTPKHLTDDVVKDIRDAYKECMRAPGAPLSYPDKKPTTVVELKNDLTYLVEVLTGHRPTPRVIHDVVTGARYANAPGPVFPTRAMTTAAEVVRPTRTRRVVELVQFVPTPGGSVRRQVLARVPVADNADVYSRVVDVDVDRATGTVTTAPATPAGRIDDPRPIVIGSDLAGHVVAAGGIEIVDPSGIGGKKAKKSPRKKARK